jgi:hypothetical protein
MFTGSFRRTEKITLDSVSKRNGAQLARKHHEIFGLEPTQSCSQPRGKSPKANPCKKLHVASRAKTSLTLLHFYRTASQVVDYQWSG